MGGLKDLNLKTWGSKPEDVKTESLETTFDFNLPEIEEVEEEVEEIIPEPKKKTARKPRTSQKIETNEAAKNAFKDLFLSLFGHICDGHHSARFSQAKILAESFGIDFDELIAETQTTINQQKAFRRRH